MFKQKYFEIGTLVVVWRDNGEALLTTTRTEVDQSIAGGVVWVNGISGFYAVEHVRPVVVHPTADKIMADREYQRRADFGSNGDATTPGFFKKD